jgi:hypothetical protein
MVFLFDQLLDLALPSVTDSSQDRDLVSLLASLAAEASQNVVASLEDNDSMISQVLPSSAEVHREIELESLEMSQRIWDNPENDYDKTTEEARFGTLHAEPGHQRNVDQEQ